MIPDVEIQTTESVRIRFDESSPTDMLACELITQRYEGIEMPLLVFSRDGYKTLVVPRTIRPTFLDAKPITDKETSLLRLPAKGL